MNLVSTILQLLAPAVINRIAPSLGLSQGLVSKAISAAIPTILAALTGMASKAGGGTQLSNVLAKQDPGLLGNLGNLIGGAGQQSLIDSGTNALSSLLGGSSTNAIAGALGKFAGLNGSQSGSLLGMVAPVVLGQLAQTQKASGLDANGLVSLLNSQKSNIAAAMPAGFSKLLEGSGVLNSIAGNLKSDATPPAPVQNAGFKLPPWLLPLGLGVLGLYLLSSYGCHRTAENGTAPTVPPAVTAPTDNTPAAMPQPKAEVPAAPTPAAPNTDLVGLATKALDGLNTVLGGIKDEATATTAVPGLRDIAKQIDAVKTSASLLSGDAKKPLATLVAGALPGITSAVAKAVGIPGVGAIINPIIQPVVANLEALSKS